ncbi:MAG: serine hydrolase [Dermatophilaceae bacterium]
MPGSAVADRLAEIVAAAPGRACVAVRSSRGFAWDHDSDRVVPAASTAKVPILLAVLASGVPLDRALPLTEDRVGGCGPLHLLPSVRSLTVLELARLMIALSDNDAANALLDAVGFEAVATVLAAAGAGHTVVRRRFMDLAAARADRDNLTTAADLTRVLVALRGGRLLDAAMTQLAVDILQEQQFADGLPAYLPSRVRVGSKVGVRPGLRHDMALVQGGREWVAVAVLVTDLVDTSGVDRGTIALATQAEIGRCLVGLL